MLSSEERQKLTGTYKWSSTQEKANYYKNRRIHLKKRIGELSELVDIMKNLPPRVLENAKLTEDFTTVIEFIDTFLEVTDPLPVAKHESGETRVFQNTWKIMDDHPNVDGWEEMGYIKSLDGKKYLLGTDSWTATDGEIRRSKLLKMHIEKLQKYVDPSIVAREQEKASVNVLNYHDKLDDLVEIIGHYDSSFWRIKPTDSIPTNPPCLPRIIVKKEEPQ